MLEPLHPCPQIHEERPVLRLFFLGQFEDAVESLDSLARWRDLVAANSDLVATARTAADIRAIVASGRFGSPSTRLRTVCRPTPIDSMS